MVNRPILNQLMEYLTCGGILLSLCAVIILGPQPKSGELATSASAKRAETSAPEESRMNISHDPIHHASMRYLNP